MRDQTAGAGARPAGRHPNSLSASRSRHPQSLTSRRHAAPLASCSAFVLAVFTGYGGVMEHPTAFGAAYAIMQPNLQQTPNNYAKDR
jgi:hypothetical protein